MRWSTYRAVDGGDRVALVHEDRLHAVRGVGSLLELLDDPDAMAAAASRAVADPVEVADPENVVLRPPVPTPPSVRDFMAFEEHVRNARTTVDAGWYEQPVFYFSNPASLLGARDDVAVPPGCERLDYELEVAAVVGRPGANLSPEQADEHIGGFVLFCDWSARDLQATEMRQRLGPAKGKDFATSLGPWLVTPDELDARASGRGYDLSMTASVNGRPYSSGNMGDLYWSFAEMIAHASRGTRVVTGDVLGSGTVGTGCILELSRLHGEADYPYLRKGDEVHLEGDLLSAVDARVIAGPPLRPLRGGERA
ncbi:MAG: fumarylacetoacetate hydrolase family protein [Streptosporangiales bacterium]